jgi:hypothetical protein
MTLSASKNLSMMKALEGHFLKILSETFYSLIFENLVYYNREVAMGICFNPNE